MPRPPAAEYRRQNKSCAGDPVRRAVLASLTAINIDGARLGAYAAGFLSFVGHVRAPPETGSTSTHFPGRRGSQITVHALLAPKRSDIRGVKALFWLGGWLVTPGPGPKRPTSRGNVDVLSHLVAVRRLLSIELC